MTRASQTANERRYTEDFFRSLFLGKDAGMTFDSPAYPAPDVWVQGARFAEIAGAESIAVEVTEYHPAAWVASPSPAAKLMPAGRQNCSRPSTGQDLPTPP